MMVVGKRKTTIVRYILTVTITFNLSRLLGSEKFPFIVSIKYNHLWNYLVFELTADSIITYS